MPVWTRRGRRITPTVTWAAVGVAIVVHITVIGTGHALGIGLFGGGYGPDHDRKHDEQPEVELQASCLGDALIASAARHTMCLAPWQADVDACVDSARLDTLLDLSSCSARHETSVAQFSMLDAKTAEKVKPIDPEPLLEALNQDKPKPPPPIPPPTPATPAPPPPPPQPAPKRPMQVVETAKPTNEQAPDNARFLAEFDTRVEHQTVARGTPKEPMVAKSKPAELQAKENPQEASVKEHPEDRPRGADTRAPDVPGSLAMRQPGAQAPAELPQDQKTRGSLSGPNDRLALDGMIPRKGDGAIEQQHHDRPETARGQGGAGGGAPDVPNLKPSQDVLERALGGGNVDHLEQVDNGDETALNAKRWIYASFFNRLKRQVAQNWDPASVWRRIDPGGQVYGYKTRVTEVRVSLSSHGDVAKVFVTSPSGVSELDDEAVRSFHSAAPFPNPPKELVGSDNLITFAFSFYFEIGSPHTSWRVIRSM